MQTLVISCPTYPSRDGFPEPAALLRGMSDDDGPYDMHGKGAYITVVCAGPDRGESAPWCEEILRIG